MPNLVLFNYDDWTHKLDQSSVMASAAELHGLISGMLSAGMIAEGQKILPLLQDFINDGQAFGAALKQDIGELVVETARQLADEEFGFGLLVPTDDDALTERLEALVDWAQAFMVGFAVQQHDLSVCSEDVREAIDQFTEITRIDVYGQDEESTEADNEESYFLVLEHMRVLVLTCYQEVGLKFGTDKTPNKTLH